MFFKVTGAGPATLLGLLGLLPCASALAQEGDTSEPNPAPASTPGAPVDPSAEPNTAAPPAAADQTAASREQEEAEIAAEMAKQSAANPSTPPAAPGAAGVTADASGASGSSRGLSNAMNPALSVAGVLLAGASSRPARAVATAGDLTTGIFVQEVELRASAIVDPFFRADVSLAGSADQIAFEEAYLTTLELPRVTFRAGQMHSAVGRHNILHTHAFPFITAPLPWRALMGEEGLSDPGISADILLPLPFYTEINAEVFQGDWTPLEGSIPDNPATAADESVPDQRRASDFAYVGHLKTLFDVSDATTFELGASYVGGRNGFGGFSNLAAGDMTVKWKPIEAERYMGFDWTTEYAMSERGDAPSDGKRGGGYTAVRFQFAQQWWLQARGAVLGLPQGESERIWRGEALGAFVPSEFSALRLQYGIEKAENSPSPLVHEVFAQAVFSIGPHPAHAY